MYLIRKCVTLFKPVLVRSFPLSVINTPSLESSTIFENSQELCGTGQLRNRHNTRHRRRQRLGWFLVVICHREVVFSLFCHAQCCIATNEQPQPILIVKIGSSGIPPLSRKSGSSEMWKPASPDVVNISPLVIKSIVSCFKNTSLNF